VGDRLVGGLGAHLLAGVRLAHQVDAAQRTGELEAGASREAEVLAGRVPRLQVALGDGSTKSRSGDATKGGGLPGRQDLLVGRCHLRFLHTAAMGSAPSRLSLLIHRAGALEVELCVIALLCRGHLLIEDVPGTGKTMLAKALARATGCSFERVQFTPDLLPGDVTGVTVYNPNARTFEFRRGPIFTQVLLADEINRATPKAQSALLEAMEERQVTVDGTTHPLPAPFIVLATQNPIELGGTFPLPEAQVDRFLLKVRLGYLPGEEEVAMLDRFQSRSPLDDLQAVASGADIRDGQNACRAVYCEPSLKDYCVRLVQRTREHPDV